MYGNVAAATRQNFNGDANHAKGVTMKMPTLVDVYAWDTDISDQRQPYGFSYLAIDMVAGHVEKNIRKLSISPECYAALLALLGRPVTRKMSQRG